MESNKICVISYGIGGWYRTGQHRLIRSLMYHGFAGEIISHTEHPYGWPTHSENPYAFKIYAFEDALQQGYTHILWLDSSVYAIADIMPVFDYINVHGIFSNVDIQIPYYCHGYKWEDQQEKECAFKRMESEIDRYYANSKFGVYKHPVGHQYEECKRLVFYG